uniref:MAT1-1-3 n=1 Tax=Hypocrella siamensis TaxID=696354 RepID=A0A0P0CM77_9HYPO|nr:MAT1-1-3 [Hypocrella siamensis]
MWPRVQIHGGTPLDVPVTFVTSEAQGDVHVFVTETFHRSVVELIATNFSRRIQQSVSVFHDVHRRKFRICPLPAGNSADATKYGMLILQCDSSERKEMPAEKEIVDEESPHRIPRPRNSWILYRQSKSRDLREKHPGSTASELSTIISELWKKETVEVKAFWKRMAKEEDRLHKERYPGYKYTTRKGEKKRS